ncbi:hypothetical protein KR018_010693 [Drosophila ironensis]|nr:hypothetical protein KR018_010693 [Drosophila ironensis]
MMEEPNAEMLDRHFRQQVDRYHSEDYKTASQSDRQIAAKWLTVFEQVPPAQKLARNGLMLLLHGHLTELGNLKAPFTDIRNCKMDLNDVLDRYPGLHESIGQKNAELQDHQKYSILSRITSQTNRFSSRNWILSAILEDTESSEVGLTSSSSGMRRKSAISPRWQSVREKIQNYENRSVKKEPIISKSECNANQRRYHYGEGQKIPESPRCVTRSSSAVQKMRNCFQEMADRLRECSEKSDKAFPGKIRKIVKEKKVVSFGNPETVFKSDNSHASKEIVRSATRVFEGLRSTSGETDIRSEKPNPLVDESDVKAFEICAREALERLKRWKGSPDSLHFFKTCFNISNIDSGIEEWKRLDEELEHELDIFIHRRLKMKMKDVCSKQNKDFNLLENRGQLLCWVKLKELCQIHGRGKIQSDVLQKISTAVDDKCDKLEVEMQMHKERM